MIECETIISKWGDDFIAILPYEEVQREHLEENEIVHVIVIKKE